MSLDADVLARMMVMQTMIGNLPTEETILEFLGRGLEDVPGVSRAWHTKDAPSSDTGNVESFSIKVGDHSYGALSLEITEREAFEEYLPYINNLCFMVGISLDGRRLKELARGNEQLLIDRVRERTLQLSHQIEERRAAEHLAIEEKERLSVTLRSIGDGVITTDTNGLVVILNRVAEELTGWSQEDAKGQHIDAILKLINEHTREPCPPPLQAVMQTEEIIELSNNSILISRDGTERVISDSGAPILDMYGKVIGTVLVFRDTTDKQRMLDHLRQSDKLESLGLMAGGIAHDFNNLLAGLIGFIDLARGEVGDESSAANYLDQASAVFDLTKTLTHQLLTFSKGGEPIRKVTPMKELLTNSAKFSLAGSAVSHSLDIPDDLWCCKIDENQTGQVIDNICINAQEAMSKGGSVQISAHNAVLKDHCALSPGNYVSISFTDSGAGISRDNLAKIFDPFFTTKEQGTGLGLATCYSIMQKHGGHIEVESVDGEGATFTITLPATGSIQEDVDTCDLNEIIHVGGTVLVMDDKDFMRELAEDMLGSLGYACVAVEHGQAAIDIAKALPTDPPGESPLRAIILDLTVPGGMGGEEAVSELRKQFPDLPIFASSGYSDNPVMANPKSYGFTDSLSKPYRHKDLSTMFARHLTT